MRFGLDQTVNCIGIRKRSYKHGDQLKIAVMCPPDIYGRGHGPGRRRSAYFPFFWKDIMTVGASFHAEDGVNTRSFVHIDDLMEIYLRVVEAAAASGAGADWGKEVCFAVKYATLFANRVPVGILFRHDTGGKPNRHCHSNSAGAQSPRRNPARQPPSSA